MSRSIYLDFGANAGDTVADYLASHEVDKCWAFEPNPVLANDLRVRFAGKPVEIVEAAAWSSDGTMPLYLGHSHSSTLMEGKVTLENFPQYAITYDKWVDVTTLDTARWLRETLMPGDHVVMKMDVEGAEYVVLPTLLEGGAIELIAELRCEFHPERFPTYEPIHDDLLRRLAAHTRLVEWA